MVNTTNGTHKTTMRRTSSLTKDAKLSIVEDIVNRSSKVSIPVDTHEKVAMTLTSATKTQNHDEFYTEFATSLNNTIKETGVGCINLVAKDTDFVKKNFLELWSRNIVPGGKHSRDSQTTTDLATIDNQDTSLAAYNKENYMRAKPLANTDVVRKDVTGSVLGNTRIRSIKNIEELVIFSNELLSSGGVIYAICDFVGDFPNAPEGSDLSPRDSSSLGSFAVNIKNLKENNQTLIILSNSYFAKLHEKFADLVELLTFESMVNVPGLVTHLLVTPDADKEDPNDTSFNSLMDGDGIPENVVFGIYDGAQPPKRRWLDGERAREFIVDVCAQVSTVSSSYAAAKREVVRILANSQVLMPRPEIPALYEDGEPSSTLTWGTTNRRVIDVNLVRPALRKLVDDATSSSKTAPRWKQYGPEDLIPTEHYGWYSAEAREILRRVEDTVIRRAVAEGPKREAELNLDSRASDKINTEGYLTAPRSGERDLVDKSQNKLNAQQVDPGLNVELDSSRLSVNTQKASPNCFFLWGPPGIGKSVLVHAIVDAAFKLDPGGNWQEVAINLTESASSYHNESAKLTRETLHNVLSLKNKIVLLDEFANMFASGNDAHNPAIMAGERRVNSDIQGWLDIATGAGGGRNILAERGIILIATGNTFVQDALPPPIRSRMTDINMDEPSPYDFVAFADLANALCLQATQNRLSLFQVASYWKSIPGLSGGTEIPTQFINTSIKNVKSIANIDDRKKDIGRKNVTKLFFVVAADLIRQELLVHNNQQGDMENLTEYATTRGASGVPPRFASLSDTDYLGNTISSESRARNGSGMYVGFGGRKLHQAIVEYVANAANVMINVKTLDDPDSSGIDGATLKKDLDLDTAEMIRSKFSPQALYTKLVWAARETLSGILAEIRAGHHERRAIYTIGGAPPNFINNIVYGGGGTPWNPEVDGGVPSNNNSNTRDNAVTVDYMDLYTAPEDETTLIQDDQYDLDEPEPVQQPKALNAPERSNEYTINNAPTQEAEQETITQEPEVVPEKKKRGRPVGYRRNPETGKMEAPTKKESMLDSLNLGFLLLKRKNLNNRKRFM